MHRYILEKVNKDLITLSIYDHHLIKNNQIFSLNKLSSRELYNMKIIKSNGNLFFNLQLFFLYDKLRLEKHLPVAA